MIIGMVFTIIASSDLSDQFTRSLFAYFTCEASGYIDGNCDRSIFEQHNLSWVVVVIIVLLATVPIVGLVFVVNMNNIKKRLFGGDQQKSTQKDYSSPHVFSMYQDINKIYANLSNEDEFLY